MKVLVATRKEQLGENIIFCLKLGWPDIIITLTAKGSECIELADSQSPDLMIADFHLPDMNIHDLVGEVREFSDIPLIVLMNGQSDMDKARVLESGADDYICDPFSPIDFMAKIRALLRRVNANNLRNNDKPIIKGKLTINVSTYEVFLSGKQVKLTNREYKMLLQLVRNEGKVVTHRSFLKNIWGPEYVEDCEFTKKYICRLRQKLNDDASRPRMILTERGIGYRFISPS